MDLYSRSTKRQGFSMRKEIYPYITEGIGEDILPKNVDFDVIDYFEKVSDKDGAVFTRRLAVEEGLMMGYSAGSAIAGLLQLKDQLKPDDVVVIILHDHGSRYVGKVYNDDWMREERFLDGELKIKDLISNEGHFRISVFKYRNDCQRSTEDHERERYFSNACGEKW